MDTFKSVLARLRELCEYAEMGACPGELFMHVGNASQKGSYIILHDALAPYVQKKILVNELARMGATADFLVQPQGARGLIRLLRIRELTPTASPAPAVPVVS